MEFISSMLYKYFVCENVGVFIFISIVYLELFDGMVCILIENLFILLLIGFLIN